jgi:hypothetical protein
MATLMMLESTPLRNTFRVSLTETQSICSDWYLTIIGPDIPSATFTHENTDNSETAAAYIQSPHLLGTASGPGMKSHAADGASLPSAFGIAVNHIQTASVHPDLDALNQEEGPVSTTNFVARLGNLQGTPMEEGLHHFNHTNYTSRPFNWGELGEQLSTP